jgi:hypothetical protein
MGIDDVAELRALFRRADPVARRLGLALLADREASELDASSARAVLEAAGGAYARLEGEPADPAEEFARLLWDAPHLVDPSDVLRVHLVAGARARRALVGLLALRGGTEGLAALEVVLGPDADPGAVPAPTTPLLEPLLVHDDPERVARLLAVLLGRPAWRWHAADLLGRLAGTGRLGPGALEAVRGALGEALGDLVTTCDAGAAAGDGTGHGTGDAARSARATLRALTRLLPSVREPGVCAVLDLAVARMLGSADPVVAALAVAERVRTGEPVAPERCALLARDPLARVELSEAFGDAIAGFGPADPHYGDVALHEGRLVRFLAGATELGRAPDEVEHLGEHRVGDDRAGSVHLFRFRLRAPHWSSARGWMVGASGAFTSTLYEAEDERTPAGHVAALAAESERWPDRHPGGPT